MATPESNNQIRAELSILREQFKLLSELAGFCVLSEYQQRLIQLSLYISSRWKRVDVAEQSSQEQKRRAAAAFDLETLVGPYARSDEHILKWYCTAAVIALEQASSQQLPRIREISLQSFHSFYEGVEHDFLVATQADVEALLQYLQTVEFPQVIDIARKNHRRTERGVHTALLLGKDKNGELFAWEKEEAGAPYRLQPVQAILHAYLAKQEQYSNASSLQVGVRKLQLHDPDATEPGN